MKKVKLREVFVHKYRLYLFVILLTLIALCVLKPEWYTIAGSIVVFAIVLIYTYKKRKNALDRIVKNMNSFMLKLNTDDSILDFPFPSVIVNQEGDILWNNESFDVLFRGLSNKDKYVESIIRELDKEFDSNFAMIDRELSIHDKHYRLLGNMVKIRRRGVQEKSLMLYFIDRSEYYKLYRAYEDQKDCIGLIYIDNYDEVVQGIQDSEKSQIVALVEKHLKEWYEKTNGLFLRLDRNKYIISFERKFLKDFIESKFDVLNTVKNITYRNNVPVTLSIAISTGDQSKEEKLHDAYTAMDIALGRGGDQAVIKKDDGKYEYFGGTSKEVEKRTKVKSRVIAGAIEELFADSKNVIIMGHKNPDADCLGSALGIYRVAKSLGKDAYIVFDGKGIGLDGLVKRLNKEKIYENVFITTDEASSKLSEQSCLVVTDTHKIDYCVAPELLDRTAKIVLIDHHRRSSEFIQNPAIIFHEVYASSACELVTEIIQYVSTKVELPLVEAEALYAGILTDTKNFTFKTGVRTFEAAAYLKRLGVDVFAVKKLFDNDIDTYVAVADVIRTADKVRKDVAIAICPKEIPNAMQIAAQAADELISLNGIETSFVLVDTGEYINISGRSNGSMNVQVVLEKLGGGGHQTVAGAQVYEATIEEAKELLLSAIKAVEEEQEK
ncbi:MAG: DHH family phosphoesterase [Clostridia bacterium]|nr:DHH family phosphoesterase [Clostridia bacterium]